MQQYATILKTLGMLSNVGVPSGRDCLIGFVVSYFGMTSAHNITEKCQAVWDSVVERDSCSWAPEDGEDIEFVATQHGTCERMVLGLYNPGQYSEAATVWSSTGMFYHKWRWSVGNLRPPLLTLVRGQLEHLQRHNPTNGLLTGWEVGDYHQIDAIITLTTAGQKEVSAITVVKRDIESYISLWPRPLRCSLPACGRPC